MFYVKIWEDRATLKVFDNRFSVVGDAISKAIDTKEEWREGMNLEEIVVNSKNRHVIEIFNLLSKGYSVVYVGTSTKAEILETGFSLMSLDFAKTPFMTMDIPHLYVFNEATGYTDTSIFEKVEELKSVTGACVVVTDSTLSIILDPTIPVAIVSEEDIRYHGMPFSFLLSEVLQFPTLNLTFIKELRDLYKVNLKLHLDSEYIDGTTKYISSFAYLDEENKLQLKVKTDILRVVGNYDRETD